MNLFKLDEEEKKKYYQILKKLKLDLGNVESVDSDTFYATATYDNKSYKVYLSTYGEDYYDIQAAKQIYDQIKANNLEEEKMNLNNLKGKEKKEYEEIRQNLKIDFPSLQPTDEIDVFFAKATYNDWEYKIKLSKNDENEFCVQAANQIYIQINGLKKSNYEMYAENKQFYLMQKKTDLELCLDQLRKNKEIFSLTTLDSQIVFVASMFDLTYDEVKRALDGYKYWCV
jgi:hypothetical protein